MKAGAQIAGVRMMKAPYNTRFQMLMSEYMLFSRRSRASLTSAQVQGGFGVETSKGYSGEEKGSRKT